MLSNQYWNYKTAKLKNRSTEEELNENWRRYEGVLKENKRWPEEKLKKNRRKTEKELKKNRCVENHLRVGMTNYGVRCVENFSKVEDISINIETPCKEC